MTQHGKYETKILVLDDERLIRLAVCARLKNVGYDPVSVGTVQEAVSILKVHHRSFSAIISDIMMGDMDGFVFRDIVRGFDDNIPFFFMTALDPEEGSGFLKKILFDPMCYYLPKSAGTEVLVKRLQRVVGARRIQHFVENQVQEQKKSLTLAAHVQRSMLSARAQFGPRGFYVTWWRPHEAVSGDLYEAISLPGNMTLFVLGDIQGHGTNAALVMMAVQAFLRQMVEANLRDARSIAPEIVANGLHAFFRTNFAEVSYMTALICIHSPPSPGGAEPDVVSYITCGAPDLLVIDPVARRIVPVNPSGRGGLPIGLMPDTVYSAADTVTAELPKGVVCAAVTDGLQEIFRDDEGGEKITREQLMNLGFEVLGDACALGSLVAAPYKFAKACAEFGYNKFNDDVTILLFGKRMRLDGVYEMTTPLSPALVDAAARDMAAWCAAQGWPDELSGRLQLVLGEKLMNVYDHGFDDLQRSKDVVGVRLRRTRDNAELTVWDCGRPVPSIKVAAGVTDTAFEIVNQEMSDHGRGRLMVRQLCDGIQRQRFGTLNETVFYIPWNNTEEGVQTA